MIERPDWRAPRSVQALGYRDYRLYWTTSVVSNIGSMMYLAAIGWLVEDITDDPWKVTVAATVGLVPLLIMSPFGGSLADRYSRTRLFLVTVVGQMVVAVALAWVVQIDAETFWVLVAFSFGGGATASVGAPVQQAIVVELVPGGVMRNAVFLNSTQWNISRAVGPMLGGWLIQYWGAASAFWFNAASFTVLVIGLSFLPPRPPPGASSSQGFLADFLSGFRYASSIEGIRVVMLASFMLAAAISPTQWLAPVIADDAFGVDAAGFGILLGAFGLGSLVGAVLLLQFDPNTPYSRLVAIGMAAVAAFTLVLAVVPTFALGVVAMGGVGLAFMVTMPTLTSALQSQCDDAYRGRVMSLWMMLFGLAAPASILVQGGIASVIGIRWVLVITAVAVTAYLASQLSRGRLRHLDTAS
ncbi:MAG: MFS transporter [Acidimicrobiia bacterium]|nr:MFS transporter [bacterium]MXW58411.1 MFS transporter [Acidimicrobiia bacterium]MXZ79539.1 MFS transporter [Acidimicrobiia bacterium]MYB74983.1 MFS transporter [Acidimicrobiia bacterium]MYE71740.1 MFS transporter [Acidimicrobiia bacterium]